VEDEELARELVRRMLEDEGFHVIVAASAPEGLAVLRDAHPRVSLVICDVWMPGMTGTELVGQIRRRWPDVPVLYISGDVLPPHAPEAAFLEKPFARDRLLAAVRPLIKPRLVQ
jgi:two-component system, cell cycle sensor histidine kinase and response regulator CckA